MNLTEVIWLLSGYILKKEINMFNKIIVFLNGDDKYKGDKIFMNGRAENSEYKVFWHFKNATIVMPSLFELDIENNIYKDYELIVLNRRFDERMAVLMRFSDENDKTNAKEQMMKVIMPVGRPAPYSAIIDFDFPQLNNITKVEKDYIIFYYSYVHCCVKNTKCIKIPKEFINSSLEIELYKDEHTLIISQNGSNNIALYIAFNILNVDNELDLSDYDNVMKNITSAASKENYTKYCLSNI